MTPNYFNSRDEDLKARMEDQERPRGIFGRLRGQSSAKKPAPFRQRNNLPRAAAVPHPDHRSTYGEDESFDSQRLQNAFLADNRKDSGIGGSTIEPQEPASAEGWTTVAPKQQGQSKKALDAADQTRRFARIVRDAVPDDRKGNLKIGHGTKQGQTVQQRKTARSRLPKSRIFGNTVAGVQQIREIPVSSLLEGMLFQFQIVTHYHHAGGPLPNIPNIFQDPHGTALISKIRYCMFLKVMSFHVETLLIFTYQSKGLEGKEDDFKQEHVGIIPFGMDKRAWEDKHRTNEHPPLQIESMKDDSEQLSPLSVCRFGMSFPFQFNERGRIAGQFKPGSLELVKRLRKTVGL